MKVKGARVPFEDEKYSYVALSRSPVARLPAARVLRPTRVTKLGWTATLCQQGHAFERVVSRSEAEFARLRKLDWAMRWPTWLRQRARRDGVCAAAPFSFC